jgi:hypothetical protein
MLPFVVVDGPWWTEVKSLELASPILSISKGFMGEVAGYPRIDCRDSGGNVHHERKPLIFGLFRAFPAFFSLFKVIPWQRA